MKRTPPRVTTDTPIGPDVDLTAEVVTTADGHRLTDEVVADLVEQARTAGRPSLTAPGERSPQVTLRLPAGLLERLDAEARRRGVRRSVVIRDMLAEHLAG
ncbi:MAG: ribbon-helix-helix protein, CopG family [Nigerium sp.]|nr:ribbon-helix-helix protein, CopG family [Nigerium sp.]